MCMRLCGCVRVLNVRVCACIEMNMWLCVCVDLCVIVGVFVCVVCLCARLFVCGC